MNEENNVNQQTTNTQTLNQVNAEQSSQQAINSIPEQEVTVNNPVTVSSGQQYNVLKFENIESGKPPVAAQILYAFGILGLIFGLLMSVLAFASSNETSSFSSFFGLSSLDIWLAAIVFALIVIGAFTLINFIRSGKKWALISYTTIASIGLLSTMLDYITMSEFEKRFSDTNPIANFLPFVLIGLILVILWTKNRSYFK